MRGGGDGGDRDLNQARKLIDKTRGKRKGKGKIVQLGAIRPPYLLAVIRLNLARL